MATETVESKVYLDTKIVSKANQPTIIKDDNYLITQIESKRYLETAIVITGER